MNAKNLAEQFADELRAIADWSELEHIRRVELLVGSCFQVSAGDLELCFEDMFDIGSGEGKLDGAVVSVRLIEPGVEFTAPNRDETQVATGWEMLVMNLEGGLGGSIAKPASRPAVKSRSASEKKTKFASSEFPVITFSHVGFAVRDIDAARTWFADILGFDILLPPGVVLMDMFGHAGRRCMIANAHGVQLELEQRTDKPFPANTDPQITHLSLQVDNLSAMETYLRSKGALQENEIIIDKGAVRILCFDGIDGLRIELVESVTC